MDTGKCEFLGNLGIGFARMVDGFVIPIKAFIS